VSLRRDGSGHPIDGTEYTPDPGLFENKSEAAPERQPRQAKPAQAENERFHVSSLQGEPASWVIRNKKTGDVVYETDQRSVAEKVNTKKYEAVPIQQHLGELNDKLARRPLQRDGSGEPITGANDIEPASREGAASESGEALASLSPMKSVEANIHRGQKAMHDALLNKTSVHRAMHRPDLGWIDFEWGDEGGPVSKQGNRKGAKGIAHVLEARQRKDGMTEAQAIRFLTDDVPDVIANGEVVQPVREINGSRRVTLRYNGAEVALVKNKGSNAWTVTAYENGPMQSARDVSITDATQPGSTTTRTGLGADLGESIARDNGEAGNAKPKAFKTEEYTPETAPPELKAMADESRRAEAQYRDEQAGNAQLTRDLRHKSFIDGNRDAERLGLRAATDDLLRDAKNAPEVEYLADVDGLPEGVTVSAKTRKAANQGRLAGLYDPKTHRVFLFTDVVKTPEQARFTAMHEIAGHYGLRGLVKLFKDVKVGKKTAPEALNKALDMARQNPTIDALAKAVAKDREIADGHLATEEALADLAAAIRTGDFAKLQKRYKVAIPDAVRQGVQGAFRNFMERVKRIIRAMARRHDFSDAQVHELLEGAWRHVREGEGKAIDNVAPRASMEAQHEAFAAKTAPTYSDAIRKALSGDLTGGRGVHIGETPSVYQMLGLPDMPLATTATVIGKIHYDHGLTERQLNHLPEALTEPLAVFDSERAPGTLVAMLDMEANGEPVMVALHPNRKIGRVEVNRMASAYARGDRSVYRRWTKQGLLRYLTRERPESGTTSLLAGNRVREVVHQIRGAAKKRVPSERNVVKWWEVERGDDDEPLASITAEDYPPESFVRGDEDQPLPDDVPSRRPGESQADYTRRIFRRNKQDIKDAVSLARRERKIGRQNFRAMLAKQARARDITDAAFAQARKLFDQRDQDANLKAIDQWETERPVTDPHARAFFNLMQDAFDQRIAKIRELAPDALQNLIENYFPHIWEDTGKAGQWYASLTAKRPLAGNKSFLKQRTWPTLKKGMASGLKPVSTNPVDMVLLKLTQMDKFIAFHELRADMEARGWLKKVNAGERMPDGYAKVDDAAFRGRSTFIGADETGAEQAVSFGFDYAVPELIAKDMNGYLAPSLYRFRAWASLRTFENMLMAARLGWSLFHAGFTTLDNIVMHADVTAKQFLHGNVAGGLTTLVKTPLSVLWSPFEGHHLNRQWRAKAPADADTAAILQMLEEGGARWKMSQTDYNRALPQIIRSIRQKALGKTLK
jgi:hypothetical protein